jgi:histone H3/H4
MTNNEQISQPSLFDLNQKSTEIEKVLLYALGEFQSRGKVLAERELPLDRLRGAFKRAAEKFGIAEFSDEAIAKSLEKLNARVIKVPLFVAKHPYRVTIQADLAAQAAQIYQDSLKDD